MDRAFFRCTRCGSELDIPRDDDGNLEPPLGLEAWVMFGDHTTGSTAVICPNCATVEDWDARRQADEHEIAAAHEAIEAEARNDADEGPR